jgi:hypothetical protein
MVRNRDQPVYRLEGMIRRFIIGKLGKFITVICLFHTDGIIDGSFIYYLWSGTWLEPATSSSACRETELVKEWVSV